MMNQNHQWPGWLLCLFLTLTVALGCAVAAAEGIPIDAEHFPDPEFREAVKNQIDRANGSGEKDGVLTPEEIALGTRLIIGSNPDIENCRGLEYLTGLESFQCTCCEKVTSLNLSSLSGLRNLECYQCSLTELDLRNCHELENLMCYDNLALTTLLLPASAPLKTLSIGNTQLTLSPQTVNIYLYPELEYLDITGLQAAELNPGAFEHLTDLLCGKNQLKELDLSNNPELKYLMCADNQLETLDLSANAKLTSVTVSSNQLQELDLSVNPLVNWLNCTNNRISQLDISACIDRLEQLLCGQNQLTQLTVGDVKEINCLDCSDNQLTTLQLGKLTQINKLVCSNNQLSTLELPATEALKTLHCQGNRLTTLDIHACKTLRSLYMDGAFSENVPESGPVYFCWSHSRLGTMYADASVEIIIDAPVPVQAVTLDRPKATLTRTGKQPKPTLLLKMTVEPANADDPSVTWSSDKPAVAKVDQNGKVTALKAGRANVTCRANDGSGREARCVITVKDAKVTKITLNKTKAKLKVGKTLRLKVKKFTPASPLNTRVKWSSSKPKIAKVDKNGKVTALKKGTAVITCTAQDGSRKTAKCTITVK